MIHSLVPRLVRTWVTLVEKWPYSAANGFESTSTDSTAPLGSSRSKSPVDGSLRLALLICSAPVVGVPPLMRKPAFRTADDAGQHRQQRLKIVAGERLDDPSSRRSSTSLTATGCRLSVGELAGHDHVHALADERQTHLDEHLVRRPGSNMKGAERLSAKPSRTARSDVDVLAARRGT